MYWPLRIIDNAQDKLIAIGNLIAMGNSENGVANAKPDTIGTEVLNQRQTGLLVRTTLLRSYSISHTGC